MDDEQLHHPCHSLDTDETHLSPPSPSSSLSFLRRCSTNHPPTPSPRRLIPGPASAIQAAMHRKTPSNQPLNTHFSPHEHHRRFPHHSVDEFSRHPWLSALNFLTSSGNAGTPLSEIKKCVNAERINWVVAIVKSCTSNGLGDMRITLKDQTDTIDATVHGKVFAGGNFVNLLTVGSVLILQKVVAFSSSWMSCYLNVTRSNIVKVIPVECEVQNFSQANRDITPVLSGKSAMPERSSALVCGTAERLIGDVNGSTGMNGSAVDVELTGKEHCMHPINHSSSRQTVNAAGKVLEEPVHIDLVDSGHSTFSCYSKRQGTNSGRTSQPDPGSLEGIYRNRQNLDNDVRRLVRECSSAPSIIENLGHRNWQANDGQSERLLQGINCNVTTTEKFETCVKPKNSVDIDICDVNDVQKHDFRVGNSSAPGKVEKLTKRVISEINGGLNTQMPLQMKGGIATSIVVAKEDEQAHQNQTNDQQSTGANSMKKQKLALISRTALQEWTDEQLCILDIDED